MAEQTKNLILKLKLNVDDTEGKKLVTLVKEQTQSLAAITAETKKLKDAEVERKNQLAAINKQIKEQINEQKAAQKTALDELNKKVTEANAKLELQVKGWQLIPTNIQAAINKYNKLQEALDKEVATKLRLLNIEKESLSAVDEAVRQAARQAEFIKKVEAQAVKQKGTDYTLVEKALQESFNRRKQVQDSYNVLISELEAAAFAKKLADHKAYQALYDYTEKEANKTRLKNAKETISAMAQAAKQAQADSLQNIKAKADLEKAGKVYADEYTAAVAKRVTSEQKITNELSLQNALRNKAVTESITLNTLEELRRSREAAGYSNYKLHLENLLQASKKITAELEVQTQLEAARSKGYSFTGATSSKSTTPALTGSGLTSATSQVQGAYSFTTAGTVAANKEKADKEAADLARTRIQKELAEQTEAAKQLYQTRMGAFKASITEQDALMQHSVALQTAVQIHGINSVQAERVRATEATRQLERTRQATVSDVHAQVSTGGISTTEGMSRIAAANKEYASGVSGTTQKVHDLDKALANTTERHRNLFLRVGEAIGAYRIWNTVISYTKEALMAIPKAGIELESTKAALFGIFGSEQGAKNMQFLSELADHAGQSLLGLEQAYRRYAPSAILAGASQEAINKSFKDFAEVGTILHLPEEKINSLFLALDQMFAKGVVQSEEIKKQLGNVLPGAVEIGAKAMGKSPADFMEAMSKNLVIAKDFVPKFAAIYRQTFGGADDSVFESIRNKLLSNLQRVQNEYLLINRDIYDITKSTMNDVVRTIAEALTAIRENLTGIGQAFQIFAGLVTLRLGVALVSALSNITLGIQKLSAAMAILTGVSNPVALALAAITVAIIATYANLNKLSISYDSATGFMVNFKNSQVTLTSYLKATAIVTVDNLRESFNSLFETRTTGEEWSTWLATKFAFVIHPIDTLKQSIFQLIAAQDALFHMGSVDTPSFGEAYTAKLTELMKADQERVGTFNAEVLATAQKIDIDNLIESFEGKSAKLVSDAIKQKRLTTNEEITRALALTEDIPAQVIAPPKETPPKGDAGAAARALKDSYKDILRDSKLANQETETLLDELASKYADNLVSIKDYYAERVSLQLQNIENEKTFQGEIIKQASAAGDTANVEKARDQIELLNEKAKQFQPIADKERINDLRTYNATLANTTASYLEMTGATVAAAKARLEIQNAPLKQQLQTQSTDLTSTPAERTKATNVLGQVTAGEEITKIRAAAEAAQRYRDQINEITLAYTQMGATSSDVLTASLGGFAPLFNLFDNFTLRQEEMQLKMVDLLAKGQELAQIKIEVKKEGNNDAIAANQKEIETNAKQTQVLDKQIAQNKLKTIGEALFTIEGLTKKGSIANKIAHAAAIAANIAEKISLLANLGVQGALAILAQGKEGGVAAFAKMAAMAALVAGIIASVAGASGGGGGGGGAGGGESLPTTVIHTEQTAATGIGTVLGGDKETLSDSLHRSLEVLIDVGYKSYRELVLLNSNLTKTSNSLAAIVIASARGALITNTGFNDPMFTGKKKKGTSSSKTLSDQGLISGGLSMEDILKGLETLTYDFVTIQHILIKKKKITITFYDLFKTASKATSDLFTDLYRGIADTVIGMASQVSASAVEAAKNYTFDVIKMSFFGKNAKEVGELLQGVISGQLDKVMFAVFGEMFGNLQQMGEGMGETMTRLFTQKAVASQGFKKLDIEFPVTTEAGIKLADALIQVSSNADTAAGKLKEFAQQEAEFYKNFISIGQQANDTIKSFSASLYDIFNTGLTKEQAKGGQDLIPVVTNTASAAQEDLDTATATYKATYAAYAATKNKTMGLVAGVWATYNVIVDAQTKLTAAQASDTATNLANNISANENKTALFASIAKDFKDAKAAYDTTPTTANLVKFNRAQKEYDHLVTKGVPLFTSLQDVFFDTLQTTGNFGDALVEMQRNLDLTTDSGIKTHAMLNQIGTQFTTLINDILTPVQNQITAIADSIDPSTEAELRAKLAKSRDYTEQKSLTAKITKLIMDKYNAEKNAIISLKNTYLALGETVKQMLLGPLSVLSPLQKLTQAHIDYQDLLTKSRSTDLTVAADATAKLGASASNYLTQAMSYYGATEQYSVIFADITNTLRRLSTGDTTAPSTTTLTIDAMGRAVTTVATTTLDALGRATTTTTTRTIGALGTAITTVSTTSLDNLGRAVVNTTTTTTRNSLDAIGRAVVTVTTEKTGTTLDAAGKKLTTSATTIATTAFDSLGRTLKTSTTTSIDALGRTLTTSSNSIASTITTALGIKITTLATTSIDKLGTKLTTLSTTTTDALGRTLTTLATTSTTSSGTVLRTLATTTINAIGTATTTTTTTAIDKAGKATTTVTTTAVAAVARAATTSLDTAIAKLGRDAITSLGTLTTATTLAVTNTIKDNLEDLVINDPVVSASAALQRLVTSSLSLNNAFILLRGNAKVKVDTTTDIKKAITANEEAQAYYLPFVLAGAVALSTLTNLQTQLTQLQKDLVAARKRDAKANAPVTTVGTAAEGGTTSGLTLVGERGPELIRFPNNTRISSNNATNKILEGTNKETLNVLHAMKNELVILNDRMGTIERKTRLSKPMMSAA